MAAGFEGHDAQRKADSLLLVILAAARIGLRDACRAITVHFESNGRALLVAAVVPGGLLAAALLAVAGAALSRQRLLIASAIGMLAQTLVVFSVVPLTLLAGAGLVLLARRVPPASRDILR